MKTVFKKKYLGIFFCFIELNTWDKAICARTHAGALLEQSDDRFQGTRSMLERAGINPQSLA